MTPTWFILLVSAEYLIAAVWFAALGDYRMALFSAGCVIANLGLCLP